MTSIIAIPTNSPNQKAYNNKYAEWVYNMGFSPMVIPYFQNNWEKHVEDIINVADGLLLSGGIDVSPILYKENIQKSRGCNLDFDHFQKACYEFALKNDMPVFGVCRGHQLIAVLEGGDLDKHVGEHSQADLNIQRSEFFHQTISENGNKIFNVNSLHHQTVDKLPKEFIHVFKSTNSSSTDIKTGSVYLRHSEVMMNIDKNVCSVQFHPEELCVAEFDEMFIKTMGKQLIKLKEEYCDK